LEGRLLENLKVSRFLPTRNSGLETRPKRKGAGWNLNFSRNFKGLGRRVPGRKKVGLRANSLFTKEGPLVKKVGAKRKGIFLIFGGLGKQFISGEEFIRENWRQRKGFLIY